MPLSMEKQSSLNRVQTLFCMLVPNCLYMHAGISMDAAEKLGCNNYACMLEL